MLRFVTRLYLAALLFLCAPAMAVQVCSWDQPGHNPFVGDRQAAIMSYVHIPFADRLRLAWQVRFGSPSDTVSIGANGITGHPSYTYSDINDMHFGRGSRCESISRAGWPLGHTEPAKAYRRGNWCVIIPVVCGNVSWATCDQAPRAAALGAARRFNSVPEPGTIALVLAALAAMLMLGRKRRGSR